MLCTEACHEIAAGALSNLKKEKKNVLKIALSISSSQAQGEIFFENLEAKKRPKHEWVEYPRILKTKVHGVCGKT